MKAAIKAVKKGNSVGIDKIQVDLLQARGEDMINAMTSLSKQMWKDVKNRRMTYPMDPVNSDYTPKELILTAVPELSNHQTHWPSKQNNFWIILNTPDNQVKVFLKSMKT